MYFPIMIEAETLSDAWQQAVTRIMKDGHDRYVEAPEYKCSTKDSPMFIVVKNPLGEKKLHPLSPVTREIADEYARNLIYGMPDAEAENKFDYTYFSRLRCYPDCEVRAGVTGRGTSDKDDIEKVSGGKCVLQRIDQVKMAIENLRKDPTRRSVVMHTWIPSRDLVKFGPKRDKSSSPCLVLIHPQVVDGKIHFNVVMKTNDLFNAWPLNAYAFAALQEYMAKELNLEVGIYTHFSVAMQIYDDMYEMATEVINCKEELVE